MRREEWLWHAIIMKVLGVQRNASEADIKKRIASWQKISPDMNKETRRPRRRKSLKEVNEAYSVLSDAKAPPVRFYGHDAFTQAASGAGSGPGGFGGFGGFGGGFWRV